MRPVEFGEPLLAGTRLTLFSDDKPDRFFTVCTSPEKTDTGIWLTNTVSGLIRTLHFVQGRNPA
jgi:hypothetical protein